MTTVHIYTLSDPRTNEVRYVGKATDLVARVRGHIKDKANTHKVHWIRKLIREGVKPKIEALETFIDPTGETWEEAERFWIETLRFYGARLTNAKEGGIGGRHNAESKAKCSAWQLGRKLSAEHIAHMSEANKGRRHREDVKQKISRALKGKPFSESHRKNLSKAFKGRVMSEEWLSKISASLKGKKMSPESIAKRVSAFKETVKRQGGIKYDPEKRRLGLEKISQGQRGRKHSEATLKKMSEARALWHRRNKAKCEASQLILFG